MPFTSATARLYGAIGSNRRAAEMDGHLMVLPAMNARFQKLYDAVDAHARATGVYPLPPKERQRRYQRRLNAQMAELRACRLKPKRGPKPRTP